MGTNSHSRANCFGGTTAASAFRFRASPGSHCPAATASAVSPVRSGSAPGAALARVAGRRVVVSGASLRRGEAGGRVLVCMAVG